MRHEAEQVARSEPTLCGFLFSTILNHDSLEGAVIHRVAARHLGVTRFGQSGDLAAVYRYHRIDADSIVAAALDIR